MIYITKPGTKKKKKVMTSRRHNDVTRCRSVGRFASADAKYPIAFSRHSSPRQLQFPLFVKCNCNNNSNNNNHDPSLTVGEVGGWVGDWLV